MPVKLLIQNFIQSLVAYAKITVCRTEFSQENQMRVQNGQLLLSSKGTVLGEKWIETLCTWKENIVLRPSLFALSQKKKTVSSFTVHQTTEAFSSAQFIIGAITNNCVGKERHFHSREIVISCSLILLKNKNVKIPSCCSFITLIFHIWYIHTILIHSVPRGMET